MTISLTVPVPGSMPLPLILQYFQLQNHEKRGNYLEAGKIILRHIYNNSEDKIDYSAIDGLTSNQAKKFVAILRSDGYINKTLRNHIPVAHINHVKFKIMDEQFQKTSWRWAFMICTKELSWEICKKAGKLEVFSYRDIQLKIIDMIRKGYSHCFRTIKRFKAYMIKFLSSELNSPKFLAWMQNQFDRNNIDLKNIAIKSSVALKRMWITLKTSVSYLMKNQDKLCFKNILSRDEDKKEKEKLTKEKERKFADDIHKRAGLGYHKDLDYPKSLLNQGF